MVGGCYELIDIVWGMYYELLLCYCTAPSTSLADKTGDDQECENALLQSVWFLLKAESMLDPGKAADL